MTAKFFSTLDKDFLQYCELNNIEDVEAEAKRIFGIGFTITKYGTKPGETKSNLPDYKDPPPPPQGRKLNERGETIREGNRITNMKGPAKTPKPIVKSAPQSKVKYDE